MQLPTPHELLALIAETSPKQASFNEQDRIRFGREFSDAWPAQQVQREDDAAHFTPSITGSTGLMGLAYALYYFLLPGFDDLPLLTFQWQAPPPQGCFWVGLADFDTNCWRWFDCRDLDSMNIFWMSRHLDPDGSFLMVLAATGTTPSTLQWLRVGGNAPPLAKLTLLPQGDSAPLIVGFDASASVDLDGVITHYSWDFDGDGLYDEHTLDTPSTIHTYEEPGVYQPLVMVQDAHVACSTTSAELTVGGPPVAVLDADPLDGYAPLEVTAAVGPSILHVHATDAAGQTSSPYSSSAALGEGAADFPALLGALEEHGYNGYFTVGCQGRDEPNHEIGQAIGYLRAI